ncbi:hypothetical protein M413DRAFT_443312 [Hebeloma cylindrosporum]|uniref:Uncharacterized protein n=1 Tax=Hebeloma cylindrosporum TaxID=76867 RepID=A0A0C2Y387_HEBCY|nr:hypothetical protein M413DRAFT_443312 [Hebeloma cylindrosporum h7]
MHHFTERAFEIASSMGDLRKGSNKPKRREHLGNRLCFCKVHTYKQPNPLNPSTASWAADFGPTLMHSL